jgi:hypothetical protein
MIIHHIKLEDITRLEIQFAVFTKDGWKIPAWVSLLKASRK